jgi:hypothetical protein
LSCTRPIPVTSRSGSERSLRWDRKLSEPRIRADFRGSPRGGPPAVTRWILWYWLDSAADLSCTTALRTTPWT